MEIKALGDSALLIRVAENFDDAPGNALNKVLATKRGLETAQIPGSIETAPAYTTVALFYDPTRAIDAGAPIENVFGWIEQRSRQALSNAGEIHADRSETSLVEIPVCYEQEFALDLDEGARHAGVRWKEVVDRHCEADPAVHCVGFTRRFAFPG